jgi:hypothetical protein
MLRSHLAILLTSIVSMGIAPIRASGVGYGSPLPAEPEGGVGRSFVPLAEGVSDVARSYLDLEEESFFGSWAKRDEERFPTPQDPASLIATLGPSSTYAMVDAHIALLREQLRRMEASAYPGFGTSYSGVSASVWLALPEPGTLALLGFGLVAIGLGRRHG